MVAPARRTGAGSPSSASVFRALASSATGCSWMTMASSPVRALRRESTWRSRSSSATLVRSRPGRSRARWWCTFDAMETTISVYLDYQTHLCPGVHQVQQHLVTHPAGRETLAELGVIAGMSERNLTRVFKRATGISIHDYRERLRIERARDLLRNPTMTLDAVAAACGFADARQLRRLWSSRFGEPPSAARRTGAARTPLRHRQREE